MKRIIVGVVIFFFFFFVGHKSVLSGQQINSFLLSTLSTHIVMKYTGNNSLLFDVS